jgi:4-hydroxy-3-polyprenylbenzoate decarboxylase
LILRRIVVGISGASGIVLGVRALEMLAAAGVETHLVMSKSAELTAHHELERDLDSVKALATAFYPVKNVGATIASVSFITDGMLIAPCSVRTMSEIASGVTSSLLTRAADVVLKERRRLVLMVRETPLHTGHLRTMTALSEMGAVIAPPVPAFYTGARTLDEFATQSVGRVLDLFGISDTPISRWQG